MEAKIRSMVSNKVLKLIALRIPTRKCGEFIKMLRPEKLLFRHGRVRCIIEDPQAAPAMDEHKNDGTKLMLLDPRVETVDLPGFPDKLRSFLSEHGAEPLPYELNIPIADRTYDDLVRDVLPAEVSIPMSFERIGHIAHFNLLDEHKPYADKIAQVLMFKNPGIRTVVNKLGQITNEFRVFPMEILCGDSDLTTTVREHGHVFRFDFSKCYWNSRLDTEHARVANSIQSGERVWDMFCGIGPFAIPLSKKRAIVYANDLNPDSIKYLRENMTLNKIQTSFLSPYNLDARDFIRQMGAKVMTGEVKLAQHVIMNLPKIGMEFVDVFHGLFSGDAKVNIADMPEIKMHVYCFCPETEQETLITRLSTALGTSISASQLYIHHVRSVAPNKEMYCVEFNLPHSVLLGTCVPYHATTTTTTEEIRKRKQSVLETDDQMIQEPNKRTKI